MSVDVQNRDRAVMSSGVPGYSSPVRQQLRETSERRQRSPDARNGTRTATQQVDLVRDSAAVRELRETAVRRRMISGVRSGERITIQQLDRVHDSAAIRELRETAVRRNMYAMLAEVGQALDQWPHHDPLAVTIRDVHRTFLRYLSSSVDARTLFQNFIHLVRHAMIDPIRLAPLDEEAVLGQDERTYGRRTLLIYLSTLSPQERVRCPFIPVRRHALARTVVRLLQRQGAHLHVNALEQEYQSLVLRGPLPILPTADTIQEQQRGLSLLERIARIAQQQRTLEVERQQTSEDALREVFTAGAVRIEAAVEASLQEMREEEGQARREQDELVRQLAERDTLELRPLQEAIRICHARNASLRGEAAELEREVRQVRSGISEMETCYVQLQTDVNRLERELAERDSDWLGQLLVVCVCVAVSYILPQGMAVSATPGGVKMGMTFTL